EAARAKASSHPGHPRKVRPQQGTRPLTPSSLLFARDGVVEVARRGRLRSQTTPAQGSTLGRGPRAETETPAGFCARPAKPLGSSWKRLPGVAADHLINREAEPRRIRHDHSVVRPLAPCQCPRKWHMRAPTDPPTHS